jgi:orotidine-5'-phosphate decarboxylase
MRAFADTIALARERGLIVIVDAKRNDIESTAQAYANAFLGTAPLRGGSQRGFDVDCITVSPFLGRDSLEPFVETCGEHGKGIFVLVKTSNPGSGDVQNQPSSDGGTISTHIARLVDELGAGLVGEFGYSSIGAVVGATFPQEAEDLRRLMPAAIALVPGYGAQGGSAADAVSSFDANGLGAVINASRSITYAFEDQALSPEAFSADVRRRATLMIDDITAALRGRSASSQMT